VNVDVREIGHQATEAARELSEQATQLAAGALASAQDIVGELVERGRELELPEPVERAAVTVRRRPARPLIALAAIVLLVLIGRAVWKRRAEAERARHDRSVADPFPEADYQSRAAAAAS